MIDNKEDEIAMTMTTSDNENEDMTSEQATAVEWLSVPENRAYIKQLMRKAAEAALEATNRTSQMISEFANIVRQIYLEKRMKSDEEESEGGVQHDRIE